MDNIVDIIVIGRGPAGLSAASSIMRQAHTAIILDSGSYRNVASKHMHTVPGWDHKDPKEFRDAATRDFDRYDMIKVVESHVQKVEQAEDGLFKATADDGSAYYGRKMILATGVYDNYPDIEGYAECWINSIFHCLYCHGWEERVAASAGVLATGDIAAPPPALHFARQVLRLSKEATIYTNGNQQLSDDITAELAKAPAPMKVDGRKIVRFSKAPNRAEIDLHFEDGSEKREAFLAHKPKATVRGPLVEQLGLELTPQGLVKVTPPFNQTTLRGVFACGDIVSPMQTVTQAMASGTACGGGATAQLQAELLNQKPLF